MSWWPSGPGSRRDRDLDEEIEAHLDLAARDRIERGASPRAARLAAQREFGNQALVKEAARAVWRWGPLDSLAQDLRYAVRMMYRSPGFTAVAVLSLALGIGANTAIFSLINTLILRPLPVREPDRLVELLSRFPGEPRTNAFAWKVYEHFRDENHVFSDLIGVSAARFDSRSAGSDSEALNGEYVAGRLFPALGIEPAIGRLIGPEEDERPGAPGAAVAVLSWALWNRRFDLDPAVVGKQIDLNGVPTTVIGVAPRSFTGLEVGSRPDLWVPAAMEPLVQQPSRRVSGELSLKLMGRLRPGVSIDQARAEMAILDRWRAEELAKNRNAPFLRQVQIEVTTAGSGFSALRDRFATPLFVLMAVVGLVLLIACSNVASLLLARGAARQQEMAMRAALGASPLRLVRQAVSEAALLSAAGSLLGIVLAYFAVGALVGVLVSGRAPIGFPQGLEIHVRPDVRVLLFTAGATLLTGLLFGMAPVWNVLASIPRTSLRETRIGETRSRRMFGRSLVVAQIALSLVLLSGAGLFIRHLSNLRNIGAGFERDSVLLVTLDPSRSGYRGSQLSGLYETLVKQLQVIPGVRSATMSGVTPIQGPGAARMINVQGFQERPEDRRYIPLNWVGPRYFATFGTPLLAGRDFEFEDEAREPVAIVNQAMAQHYFRGADPIGKRFTFEGSTTSYEIVGLVGNAKYRDLHQMPPRTIYLNAFQDSRGLAQQLALRTEVAPTAVVAEVRRAVRDLLKAVSVARVTTLAEQVDASIVTERLIALLSALFGLLGAALTAIGIYGLLAYVVARRTSEIGLRMALGATGGDVTRMVLKGAFGLVGAGLIVGAPIALLGRRVAASMVQAVAAASAEQPMTLPVETAWPIAMAVGALIGIALAAAYVPARRASSVQPIEALRHI